MYVIRRRGGYKIIGRHTKAIEKYKGAEEKKLRRTMGTTLTTTT